MSLRIKVNMAGNGFFYLKDDRDGEIATCYCPSLINKMIEIANAYNRTKGFDEITTKEAEIAKAQIRLCEANSEQKSANVDLERLKKEKADVSASEKHARPNGRPIPTENKSPRRSEAGQGRGVFTEQRQS